MLVSPTTLTARAGRKEELMTKYYFISYIFQTGNGVAYAHCLLKAVDTTLDGMVQMIQESRGCSNVVILNLKDLSKKEYKMLKGDENE